MQNYNVCRFCLKLVHVYNVELINRVTKKILALLLIKLNLDVTEDPLSCKMCLSVLNEIYMFKSNCLYSEDVISSHFEGNLKVSLRNILVKLENDQDVNIAEDETVCRLCLKIPPNGNYIILNETDEVVSQCRDIIQKQLPEINLNITEQPIICEACHVLLKNYSSFATDCMDVEQKIKMYCEHQGSDIKEQVDLLCVLQFTENRALDCENSFNEDLAVKHKNSPLHVKIEEGEEVENDNPSKAHFIDGSSTEFYIKEEEVDIKAEDDQKRMELDGMKSHQLDDSDSVEMTDSLKNKTKSRKTKSEDKIQRCPKCAYSSKYISIIKRHMRCHSHNKLSKCILCTFTADNLFSLRTHMMSHKGPTNMFSCPECPYETRKSTNLVRHLLKHKNKLEVEMYRCCLCPYENKSRETLRKHERFQHDENIKMYECKECPWSTKYSASHRRHQLLHKMGDSTKSLLSCGQCTYSTHAKEFLLRHKREKHLGPRVALQCSQCGYHTNKRTPLRLHQKTHRPTEEKFKCDQCECCTYTAVFSCTKCDFKNKCRKSVMSHMKRCLKKDDSEESIITLQCSQCDFQTNSRSSFSWHRKAHSATKQKFKCKQCEFWSFYRSKLNRHLMTHMQLGETVAYYCATCDFKTKYKHSLRDHIKRCVKKKKKDDTDSRIMLQCNQCDFSTKSRHSLYKHKNTHDPSKYRYKCQQCEYCTYDRSRLSRHLVTHMKPGEATIYSCAMCRFKSKYKDSLTFHMKSCSKEKDDTNSNVILQCKQCDFHTKCKDSLYKHKRIHDPTKYKYKCEQCEYCTYDPSNLNRHLLKHMKLNETTVYPCTGCNFKSKYKRCLTFHMERCLKMKEKGDMDSRVTLQCNQCDFHTKSRTSLSTHKRKHDPTKINFKCEHCEYSSYILSNLNRHLITHM